MALDATFGYNPDNQQNYDNVLQGYRDMISSFSGNGGVVDRGYQNMINGYANDFGAGQRNQLALQRDQNMGNAQQSAISRGLGNTTTLDALTRGVNSDYGNSLLNLNDQIATNKAGMQQNYLNWAADANKSVLGIQGAQQDFMGGAFNQKYGAGAQYASQAALQSQGAQSNFDLQSMLTKANANNSQFLQSQQLGNALQMQKNQFNFQNAYADKYGY